MENNYLIKITPISQYFFGAENKRISDDTANYFLHSLPFPQQSTVIGALRYFFLKFMCSDNIFKNNAIVNKDGAIKIIGEKSFNICETTFDFGAIKEISEVFLLKNNTPFFPLPFDKWCEKLDELTQVSNINCYYLPNYDAKKQYKVKFSNGNDTVVNFDEIFENNIQAGNKKNNKGNDDNDAFYKQEYYKLKKDWSFALELKTDIDLSTFNTPLYMTIGGENKLFKIEIINDNINIDREKIFEKFNHSKFFKIVIVSDTFTKVQDINNSALFSITHTKSFRNLLSNVNTTSKYRNRTNLKNDSMKQSSKYEIIERGSTFYFKNEIDLNNFKDKYLKNDYLNKSGMNKYIIIKPKSLN